ncbi:MAG: DUF896 domain-containing protein [Thermotaleaceae bacterium]
MITQETIDRINYLANKSKRDGLTDDEIEEQKKLRALYIESFKRNFRQQLDSIKIVDPKKD